MQSNGDLIMFSKYKTISLLFIITTFAYLGNFYTQANAQDVIAVSQEHQSEEPTEKEIQSDSATENIVNERHISIELKDESLTQQTRHLERLIYVQKNEITGLNLRVEGLLNKQKEETPWVGIMLGSLGIMVTILGVGVAILSIIGYKELLETGKKAAIKAATKTAEETAKNSIDKTVSEKSKEAISSLIENGYLDNIVNEIIQKIIYKDTALSPELVKEILGENDVEPPEESA